MGKADVIINCHPETVWAFFAKPENWSKWHGVLQEVNPGWQEGAIIAWGMGPTSTIRSCVPGKVVEIESPYLTTSFNFTPVEGEAATLVQVEFAPRGGASFSDGGRAYQAKLASQLLSLKQHVESETAEQQAAEGEAARQ